MLKFFKMKAYIINIGDEILIGDTVNTNASWMASKLDQSGVDVVKVLVIGDSESDILSSLKEALNEVDLVLITGGLGPTHDDITKHTLCKFFNDKLVENKDVLNDVTELVSRNGREVNELNKTQAMVPSKCEVIRNMKGTAPGMIFEQLGKTIVSMPGVPYEMKGMMSDVVLPRLQKFDDAEFRMHKHIRTFGIPESALAEKLAPLMANLNPKIKLAFLPSPGHVKLRFTTKGRNKKDLESILKNEAEQYLKVIDKYVYGFEGNTLEQKVGELLLESQKTICTAESCTGGKIASKFTSIPGSSSYFLGSVIAYSNEAKMKFLNVAKDLIEEFGAVSEQVVSAMAIGAREKFNTNYSLATSGIAGPDGGTEEKPVGTVWIALASEQGVVAKKLNLPFNRMTNIDFSSDYALNLLRKELKKGLIDR